MTAKNKITPWVRLGDYTEECDERNVEGRSLPFYGINKEKTFMPTVADTNQLDSSKSPLIICPAQPKRKGGHGQRQDQDRDGHLDDPQGVDHRLAPVEGLAKETDQHHKADHHTTST